MTHSVYSQEVVDELVGGLGRTQVLTLRLILEQQIVDGRKTRDEALAFIDEWEPTCRSAIEKSVFAALRSQMEAPGP